MTQKNIYNLHLTTKVSTKVAVEQIISSQKYTRTALINTLKSEII